AGTAYAAVDNHRQDDFRPRILRTHDYGRTWSAITNGLPDGHFVSVVRADPVRRGLLYAGTDVGAYVSFDDGARWQPLQRNLPVAWVRDLLVHGNDLIAATQGRAIWVLDDLSPLRQLDAKTANAGAHLFAPAPAYRVRNDQNKDTPPPAETALGRNPPDGAIIDYSLAHAAKRITLDIRDGAGHSVRRFDSNDTATEPLAEAYFAADWLMPAPKLATAAGAHRFVWNLRAPRPKAAQYGYSIAAVLGDATPVVPRGPLVLPGDYQAVLTVDGKEFRQPLVVKPDPRVQVSRADLELAAQLSQAIETELARVWQAHGEVDAVHKQLDTLTKAGSAAAQSPTREAIAAFAAKLEPLRSGKGESAPNLGAIDEALASLATDIEGADRAPTAPQEQMLVDYRGRLDRALAQWQLLREHELVALDVQLKQAGLAQVSVPAAARIKVDGAAESADLP
ncbi:MAG: WD40/YVTN/BNR-like repeat-containing protein, partial [Lysobacterales bacterium]